MGAPLVLLVVFTLLWIFWKKSGLPNDTELILATRHYFDLYGYWIVLASAIIEGMLFAGLYYPGSLVIFLGVIFAGNNKMAVTLVITLVSLGLTIAYTCNYLLGKYGWYKILLKFGLQKPIEDAQNKLTQYGKKAIFLSYWHPNLAALISTSAGILHFPFKKFLLYSIPTIIAWSAFWGILAFVIGENTIKLIGLRFAIAVAIIWLLYRGVRYKKYILTPHSQVSSP